VKDYVLHGFIPCSAIHQTLFKELIEREYYQEVGVLLSAENLERFGIVFETVEMLVVEQAVRLTTSGKIKSVRSNILLLLGVLNLDKESHHYVSAYYRYFSYLEDKGIILPS
jgi:hypothetical protein